MNKDAEIQKIEQYFKAPERAADKIQNIVEKAKGGYVLIESRPPWNGADRPWTKSSIAKFIFHNPSRKWKLYWMRASRKWEFYSEYKSLNEILRAVKEDKDGCFFG